MDLTIGTLSIDTNSKGFGIPPESDVPPLSWDNTGSNINIKLEEDVLHVAITNSWKLIDSYPSRILDINERTVLLEVVIDKENKIINERIFKRSFFSGVEIKVGDYIKLQIYERPNAQMIQALHGIQESDDFPKINLEKFSNQSLFE